MPDRARARMIAAALTNCGRAPTMVTIFIVVVFIPLGYCGYAPRAPAPSGGAHGAAAVIYALQWTIFLGDRQNEAG